MTMRRKLSILALAISACTFAAEPQQGIGPSESEWLRLAERQLAVSKAGYEAALRTGRMELAQPYYEQLIKDSNYLVELAKNHAARTYLSTGDLSAVFAIYNKYLSDGLSIDGWNQNAEGSITIRFNINGARERTERTIPKDEIRTYLLGNLLR